MWSKNPMPVSTDASPDPSRSSSTSISVSRVLRSAFAFLMFRPSIGSPPCDYFRFFSGTYVLGRYSGLYAGRMIGPALTSSSMRCAHQLTHLATAKSGV